MTSRACIAAAAAVTALATALPAAAIGVAASAGFDHGLHGGWTGSEGGGGGTFIARDIGQDRPALRTVLENFGITYANSRNAAFVGDYTTLGAVTLSLDVLADSIQFSGSEVASDLVVELRDHDNPAGGYPYTAVWARLGTLSKADGGWRTLAVTIADTSASELPPGWGGYGDEDPTTFEPKLPPGRTFANVLAGVDEIAFTTLVPGYSYGFIRFDVAVDNIAIRPLQALSSPALLPVPEPAGTALLTAGLAAIGIGARRRRSSGRAVIER